MMKNILFLKSKMEDKRKEIPIGCAINIAIINELCKTDAFTKACIETPGKFGILPPTKGAPWPFFNSSWRAYMMYCFFVVSKDLYNLNNEDIFFENLKSNKAMEDFHICKEKYSFDDNPSYHFRCFRNAISHVNYKEENGKISFWDRDHWKVEISTENLIKFLVLVNQENFKVYNEIKNGERGEDGIKK